MFISCVFMSVKETILYPLENSQNVRSIFNFYSKFSSQPVFENYYVSKSVKEAIYYRLEISQKSVLHSFSIVNLGAS